MSHTKYQKFVPLFNAFFLSYCDLASLELFLKILKFPTFLSIRHNSLISGCDILPDLGKTLTVDVSFNLLEYIKPDCFKNAIWLVSIKLNNNIISVFKREVIFQLKKLHHLNSNNNIITTLFLDFYLLVHNLEVVSIKNKFFDNLNIKIIVTDNYFICCKNPLKSTCTSVKH